MLSRAVPPAGGERSTGYALIALISSLYRVSQNFRIYRGHENSGGTAERTECEFKNSSRIKNGERARGDKRNVKFLGFREERAASPSAAS